MPNNPSRDVLLALADEVMRITTARTHADGDALAALTLELANLVDDHRNEFADALRSPGLDRDGERMRAEAAAVCQRMIAVYSGGCDGPSSDDAWAANALESARSQILCLPLAHEEKAGC